MRQGIPKCDTEFILLAIYCSLYSLPLRKVPFNKTPLRKLNFYMVINWRELVGYRWGLYSYLISALETHLWQTCVGLVHAILVYENNMCFHPFHLEDIFLDTPSSLYFLILSVLTLTQQGSLSSKEIWWRNPTQVWVFQEHSVKQIV